jgi:hypothetical protein
MYSTPLVKCVQYDRARNSLPYGLIHYKDTKTKCGHLKKLACKGTLRQVLIRVYRLDIQSVMLVFSTPDMWTIAGGGGGGTGVQLCWRPYSAGV